MSRWTGHDELKDVADSSKARKKAVEAVQAQLPGGYEATDELCVMITRRDIPYSEDELRRMGLHLCPSWLRVARTYGRKVVWFKGYDRMQNGGEIVLVGDAGTGRGWPERMAALVMDATKAWMDHREQNGWPL